jgi:pseudouridine-5'-phosphate glycosidase
MKSKDSWGATTVASTAYLANHNNMATFVTGGIGGVHRGNDLDISADLIELSRTPIVVVSAGIKSLLDVPKTLEYLETFGVPIITYGTDYLPTLFSTQSPKDMIKSPCTVETPQDVAQLYWSSRQSGLPCGMLVAVPNPMPVSHGNSGQ